MIEYISKSAVIEKIEKLIKKNELYLDDNVSDSVRFQKTGAYSVLNDLLHSINTLEVKEVDSQSKTVNNWVEIVLAMSKSMSCSLRDALSEYKKDKNKWVSWYNNRI